jgi:hypothetical protein
MKNEIFYMYDQLRAIGIHEHARDFWRIRAAKQQEQLVVDCELHEHTALKQYMQWHNQLGVRLPSFMRGVLRITLLRKEPNLRQENKTRISQDQDDSPRIFKICGLTNRLNPDDGVEIVPCQEYCQESSLAAWGPGIKRHICEVQVLIKSFAEVLERHEYRKLRDIAEK